MKFSIVSDIHLEFAPCVVENTGNTDVLVIAGDLCIADYLKRYPLKQERPENEASEKSVAVEEFLDLVTSQWKHVIYTPGNHEYYKGEFDTTDSILRAEMKKYPNIHFLQQESVILDGVKFLGATMWTDVNKADPLTEYTIRQGMNDYRLIRNSHSYSKITPAQTAREFARTYKFLEKEVSEPCVVVTHHAPSFESIDPYYKDNHVLNGAYASDLSYFILHHPEIKVWCHGHCHNQSDYTIGATRVVANPRGYYGQEAKTIKFDVKDIGIPYS